MDYEVDEKDIFTAIGRKDAAELVARSKLLEEVGDLIDKSGLTHQEMAKELGVNQDQVSMLVKGHLSEFSAEALLHYLMLLRSKL